MEKLIESIKRHEGYKDKVYMDSEGYLTCGWGHCLRLGTKVPVVVSEAFFEADLATAVSDYLRLPKKLTDNLNIPRKRVIVEMIFNLGFAKLQGFKKMLAALVAKDFETASKEMLDSKWAVQVKGRATELAEIMMKRGT